MSDEAARPSKKLPAPGEAFSPREVFNVLGVFIPEKIAASTVLSMTAKVCYGHLLRRAGKHALCWPSHRDIAKSIGVGDRQVMRALKELASFKLIRPIPRKDVTGRQTSNHYEFTWGPILQRGGDTSDTLPSARSDRETVTPLTPTGVPGTTPLEVKKINHHQGRNKEGNPARAESTVHGYSAPDSDRAFPHKADDDATTPTEYASGKDELKAIYFAKTREHFRIADLDFIEAMLAALGVSWEAFVADVRRHSWDHITNPVGFLKNRAKIFRAIARSSSAPVTAAEAAARDYRCPICSSRTPGEGACVAEGKSVPCSCASPEYIARQRARGVFPPQTDE